MIETRNSDSFSAMRCLKTVLCAASCFVAGCAVKLPDDYPSARYTKYELDSKFTVNVKDAQGNDHKEPDTTVFELAPEEQQKLNDLMNERSFPPPWTWDEGTMSESHHRLRSGQELYQHHCIHCHGVAGGGNGPTSPFLFPRPRDYRAGKFKWKSTEYAAKPTHDDLVHLLKNGAVGTSMPSFALLNQTDLDDLADYVTYLAKRGEIERSLMFLAMTENDGKLPDAEGTDATFQRIAQDWEKASGKVAEPAESMPVYAFESEDYEASVKRGKELFLGTATCVKCHLADGKADPTKMPGEERDKRDEWGLVNYPRNLTLGLFRGGRRPVDIYRRVHQGIRGTQMSGIGDKLKPKEIWDLVNFVRALPYRKGLLVETAPVVSQSPAPAEATGHGN